MSSPSASRRALWLLGAAVLMPTAAIASAESPASRYAGAQFAPPESPMVLTRTLRRSLSNGAAIVSRRSYQIRFVPEVDGFRLEGTLLSAEVEAPESLNALASLERNRPEPGLFPMRLDGAGLLLPGNGAAANPAVEAAVSAVVRQIGTSPLKTTEQVEARTFAQRVGNQSGASTWPSDLFRPAPGRSEQTRVLPLPNGTGGRVTIAVEAETQGSDGLLRQMTRTVVTEMEGSARTSHEEWTLVQDRSQ